MNQTKDERRKEIERTATRLRTKGAFVQVDYQDNSIFIYIAAGQDYMYTGKDKDVLLTEINALTEELGTSSVDTMLWYVSQE